MPYSTYNDIKKMIPELALINLTDDTDTGVANQDDIAEAIAQADAEIDTYCGARFHTPFAAVPDVIRKTSVDIAIYNLYSRRAEKIPETRVDRYKNAVRILEHISKGEISIGIDPEPAKSSHGSPESNKRLNDRVFTRDRLRGM